MLGHPETFVFVALPIGIQCFVAQLLCSEHYLPKENILKTACVALNSFYSKLHEDFLWFIEHTTIIWLMLFIVAHQCDTQPIFHITQQHNSFSLI